MSLAGKLYQVGVLYNQEESLVRGPDQDQDQDQEHGIDREVDREIDRVKGHEVTESRGHDRVPEVGALLNLIDLGSTTSLTAIRGMF